MTEPIAETVAVIELGRRGGSPTPVQPMKRIRGPQVATALTPLAGLRQTRRQRGPSSARRHEVGVSQRGSVLCRASEPPWLAMQEPGERRWIDLSNFRGRLSSAVGILFVGLCILPGLALGGECAKTGEWEDIYLIPTNPNPERNIKITLSVDNTRVRPGDTVTISFKADKDCYLTLIDVGSSKSRVIRLWPNDYSDSNNFVRANTEKRFPAVGDGFEYEIAGPAGVERIVAYATSESGKILSEEEFQSLRSTGFKEFKGAPKDLASSFGENAFSSDPDLSWGTAQVNLCISAEDASDQHSGESEEGQAENSRDRTGTQDTSAEDSEIERARQEKARASAETGESQVVVPGPKGATYVLAIGVATENLKYSDRDAQRFAVTMLSRMWVKKHNVKMILGREATYDGIAKGMKWLVAKTRPEDAAIVYFSGHGTSMPDSAPFDEPDGRDECFVLWHKGTIRDYQAALRQKILMKDDDFNALLKRIPARKKLVIADACHSGTIAKRLNPGAGHLVSKYYPLKDPSTGERMWMLKAKAVPTNYGNDNEAVMSACLDNESSYEDQARKAGLFSYHLIEAIKRGASDLRTAFTLAERATRKETESFAKKYKGEIGVQTPTLTDPHGFVRFFRVKVR